MAKEVITRITDDIDGAEGAETVTFALNGKSYEIDLATKSSEKLHKALQPFIDKARPVRGLSLVAAPKKASNGERAVQEYDKAAYKAWATSSGVWTGKRPSNDNIAAYKAAGGR